MTKIVSTNVNESRKLQINRNQEDNRAQDVLRRFLQLFRNLYRRIINIIIFHFIFWVLNSTCFQHTIRDRIAFTTYFEYQTLIQSKIWKKQSQQEMKTSWCLLAKWTTSDETLFWTRLFTLRNVFWIWWALNNKTSRRVFWRTIWDNSW